MLLFFLGIRLFVVFDSANLLNSPKSYNLDQRVYSHSSHCIAAISVICCSVQKQSK